NTEPLARSAGASTFARRGFGVRGGGEWVDLRRKYRIKEKDDIGLGQLRILRNSSCFSYFARLSSVHCSRTQYCAERAWPLQGELR
ncbi:MAG: hypothetical protein ACTHL7_07370, partial [Steroidobacteraceae bacterium]